MASLQKALVGCPKYAQAWFDAMADAAIRRSVLVAGGRRFTILEVEFYLHCADHADKYTHCSAAQLSTAGEWYFHRETAAKIGFTLKGVDITFGACGTEAGGMLIRAIEPDPAEGPIDGPSKVVDALLTAAGVVSVLDLKGLPVFRRSVFAPDGVIRIEDRANPNALTIRTGPRIGLKSGRPFFHAEYRYRAKPEQAKKDRARLVVGREVGMPPEATLQRPPVHQLTDEEIDDVLDL